MKKILFIFLIALVATFGCSQNTQTYTGNYRSIMGVMNSLSCYCYNGGYLTTDSNEKIEISFDEMEIDKVKSGRITVTGHFEEITHESQEMDPCPAGTKTIFIVESYKIENAESIANKALNKETQYFQITEHSENDYLLLKEEGDSFEYLDDKGNTIISSDKYISCFTEKFRNYALVLDEEEGFIAINRKEQIIYEVFVFDNGPDYAAEGLFRIIQNDKIGYADIKTGKIIIEPIYQAAYPFENGKAKVALVAKKIETGEHSRWESKLWININKQGEELGIKN